MGICMGTVPENVRFQRKGIAVDRAGLYARDLAADEILENVAR